MTDDLPARLPVGTNVKLAVATPSGTVWKFGRIERDGMMWSSRSVTPSGTVIEIMGPAEILPADAAVPVTEQEWARVF